MPERWPLGAMTRGAAHRLGAYTRAQYGAGRTPLALEARNSLILVALFALAFLGALFALKLARPAAAGPAANAVAPLLRVAAAPVSQAPIGVASPVAAWSAAKTQTVDRPAAPAAGSVAEQPAAEVAQPLVDAPITGVSDAADALRHSQNPADRVRAIQVLAESARDGHEVSRVRFFLQRTASGDEDPDVAARAREEYERLVEREDR